MFGKNAVAKTRPLVAGFLVNEIFYTIQGEGPWAGKPAIFLRLTGCNLRCFFCDTDFERGQSYTLDGLAAHLSRMMVSSGCLNIVITGGEPMLQEIGALIMHQELRGAAFQIETAGTVWPHSMGEAMLASTVPVVIVCSPKTPIVHKMIQVHTRAWKYIIRHGQTDTGDGLPTRSTQTPLEEARIYRGPVYNTWVQPMDEGDAAMNELNMRAAVASAMKFGYRLSIQTHKIAGVP